MSIETVEEALIWAREVTHIRRNRHAHQNIIKGKDKNYLSDDIFLIFQRAFEQKKISELQYKIFKMAVAKGDIPKDKKISELWQKMIEVIRPMMIEKGILAAGGEA